mmetsp:Transcript_24423/g.44280  ORF Transcript_24423/g.44280 Transcript_24423/m.44280 type:complete len:595 (-) Transcript_24423:306-2090(-)
MPKGIRHGFRSSRRWILSQECHNLSMIISSQARSSVPDIMIQLLSHEVSSFLRPADFFVAHSGEFEALNLDTLQRRGGPEDEWHDLGCIKVSPGADYIFATPFKKGSGKGHVFRVCSFESDSMAEISNIQTEVFGHHLAVSRHHVAVTARGGIMLLESPNLEFVSQLNLHVSAYYGCDALVFTMSGEHLLATSSSGGEQLHLLGVRPFASLMQIDLHMASLQLLEDTAGKELLAVVSGAQVQVLEVETFKTLHKYEFHTPEDNARKMCSTFSGKHVAIGTDMAQVYLVDASANTVKASIILDRRFTYEVSDLKYVGSRDTILASLSLGKIYVLHAHDLSVLGSVEIGQDCPTLELDPLLMIFVLEMEPMPGSEASSNVIQDVEHTVVETVAFRDEELLQLHADHDWAQTVEERIADSTKIDTENQNTESVYVFQFTRMPRTLIAELDTCLQLEEVRNELQDKGFSHRPQDKGRIFVWPEQYEEVMRAVGERQTPLETSHVIALESFMPIFEDIASGFSSKSNVRIKSSSMATITSVISKQGQQAPDPQEDSDSECWECVLSVERTFLTAVRVRKASDAVTQSTTEVHRGVNPRR